MTEVPIAGSIPHAISGGLAAVTVSIDGADTGPTPSQIAEYRRLLAAKDELLPRLGSALRELKTEPAQFVLVGLHIPKLDGTDAGELARFWFDRVGDDHYVYGVVCTDRWQKLRAHRDD